MALFTSILWQNNKVTWTGDLINVCSRSFIYTSTCTWAWNKLKGRSRNMFCSKSRQIHENMDKLSSKDIFCYLTSTLTSDGFYKKKKNLVCWGMPLASLSRADAAPLFCDGCRQNRWSPLLLLRSELTSCHWNPSPAAGFQGRRMDYGTPSSLKAIEKSREVTGPTPQTSAAPAPKLWWLQCADHTNGKEQLKQLCLLLPKRPLSLCRSVKFCSM